MSQRERLVKNIQIEAQTYKKWKIKLMRYISNIRYNLVEISCHQDPRRRGRENMNRTEVISEEKQWPRILKTELY